MLKSRWKSLLEMFWKFCMLLNWRTLILKTLTCFLTWRHSFLRHWIIRLFSWNPQGSNFQNINFVTAVACLLPISWFPWIRHQFLLEQKSPVMSESCVLAVSKKVNPWGFEGNLPWFVFKRLFVCHLVVLHYCHRS